MHYISYSYVFVGISSPLLAPNINCQIFAGGVMQTKYFFRRDNIIREWSIIDSHYCNSGWKQDSGWYTIKVFNIVWYQKLENGLITLYAIRF